MSNRKTVAKVEAERDLAEARQRLIEARAEHQYWTQPGRYAPGSAKWMAVEANFRVAHDEYNQAYGWLRTLRDEEERAPDIDDVTGLLDRGELDRDLAAHVERSRGEGTPVAVAVIDVDRFKSMNEELGHAAGDAVLRAVATMLSGVVTGKGEAYRMGGGDEMVIVLPNSTRPEALPVLERIRTTVEELVVPDVDRPLTLSIGVAVGVGVAPADMLSAADEAERTAKRAGGNQVKALEL